VKLYTYFRSSAAYRVRIVLALKGIEAEHRFVHMLKGGGQQHSPEYRGVNPVGLVPAIEDDGFVLAQSAAICEYIDELHPEPRLLPADIRLRAYVRMVSQTVACDIHPLNNLRVLKYLTGPLGLGEEHKLAWYRHWIAEGLGGLERVLDGHGLAGRFCLADAPTLADAFLVPQVYNALRYQCPIDAYPRIRAIYDACVAHPAFRRAAPEAQGDVE
jgi:maleylacetoacetate isomerase